MDRSEWTEVTSGAPQGTVLVPLPFTIFVKSLNSNIASRLWKFADDIKLAKPITSEDKKALQSDLNVLFNWTEICSWNVEKCKVSRGT